MAARVGLEPATFYTQGAELTREPPHPTYVCMCECMYVCMHVNVCVCACVSTACTSANVYCVTYRFRYLTFNIRRRSNYSRPDVQLFLLVQCTLSNLSSLSVSVCMFVSRSDSLALHGSLTLSLTRFLSLSLSVVVSVCLCFSLLLAFSSVTHTRSLCKYDLSAFRRFIRGQTNASPFQLNQITNSETPQLKRPKYYAHTISTQPSRLHSDSDTPAFSDRETG